MADIFTIVYLAGGVGIGWVLSYINIRKNKMIYKLTQAIKKRKPIAFLETDKACHFRVIDKGFQNLVITSEKELIINTKSSPKPCLNLGGVEIIHGDLYKSMTSPQELRLFIDKIKGEGWKDEDIAAFLAKLEIVSADNVEDSMTDDAANKKASILAKFTRKPKKEGDKPAIDPRVYEKLKEEDTKLKRALCVYKTLPSTVKDFIYTGINRTSLHDMVRELVYQRELERMGKKNWIAIAILVLLCLVGAGLFIRFAFSTEGFTALFGVGQHAAQNMPPPQIAP
jgi:hypothetical protein